MHIYAAIGPFLAGHIPLFKAAFIAVTDNPVKSAVYHIFPFISVIFNGSVPEELISQDLREAIATEIDTLREAAGIKQKVLHHISLSGFSSYGGNYSLTSPYLSISLVSLLNHQNDHDIKVIFQIARQLAYIKMNDKLAILALRITVLAMFSFVSLAPTGWVINTTVILGAIALHIALQQDIQQKMDLQAIKILQDCGEEDASQVALDTLNEMLYQNLRTRNETLLGKYYITSSGNNILEFDHSLSGRIAHLIKETEAISK
jgi:hypothetical protein